MEIAELYDIFLNHQTITTDTRHCPSGSIFFALKGERFNGNHFAKDALEKGSAFAVIDEWMDDDIKDTRIIRVSDVLKTLQELANYHRKKLKTTIIGITGSNGKTTTKELIASILSKDFKTAFTKGNYNNHIGVPLTLLSINQSHEIAVVEMGANHLGEIKQLCEIAEPNIGLITNVGKAHIEGFGSFENIVQTKCELYDFIRNNGGNVFVNADNIILNEKSADLPRILYGRDNPDLFVSGTLSEEAPFLHFDWNFFEHPHRVRTHLVGEYNLDNALAAAAIGKYFGIRAEAISNALENYEPRNNRSQFEVTQYNTLIMDAYNANPSSMKASLDYFIKIKTNLPKAVILGDMKELGQSSEQEHKIILEVVQSNHIDKIFLIGDIFESIVREDITKVLKENSLVVYNTVEKLNEHLSQHPLKGYYILLKGSNSVHLDKTVPYL